MSCELCARARKLGWWGDPKITHCKGCHRTWSRTDHQQAHCTMCHRHFGGFEGFRDHLTLEGCRAPSKRYAPDAEGVYRHVIADLGAKTAPQSGTPVSPYRNGGRGAEMASPAPANRRSRW